MKSKAWQRPTEVAYVCAFCGRPVGLPPRRGDSWYHVQDADARACMADAASEYGK